MNDVYIWLLPLGSTLPRLAAADWLFLFAVKKTSVASLNAVENIKAHEKTKNTG